MTDELIFNNLTDFNMSEIEKAKATCARLKGHFTRAKNSLAKMLAVKKGSEIIEEAFKEAKSRLTKVVWAIPLQNV